MDRRDTMAGSYYMQRGMAAPSGSGNQPHLHGIQSLSNQNVPFQSSIGSSSSSMPVDPPHGVNVGPPPPGVASSEPVKRKRGRPRKYGSDGGGVVALGLSPPSVNPGTSSSPSQKRGRGRPPGTGPKQQLASLGQWLSGSAGMGFTPHVITIAVGEDIATKLLAFSQQGPRAICILSANGAVSTVTLRQPSTSGGTVTYEGRFEILCLSGSYLLTNSSSDSRQRSGGLSVSLASPDGRVIGGGVGGMLIAASPVQVIVGSFVWGGSKAKNKKDEGTDNINETDNQPVDNPTSVPPGHSLTPTTSSVNVWPMDSHVDIQLMRR